MRGLLFDLDDTFLDGSKLSSVALARLYALRERGLLLVAVTGRPLSWGRVLAGQWPVHGIVTENGGVSTWVEGRAVRVLDRLEPKQRRLQRERLDELVHGLRRELPELSPAQDCAERLSDFTFDIGETTTVPAELVVRAVAFARARGAFVVCSSVHMHVSYDGEDKATGSLRFLSRVLGCDPTRSRHEFAFVGDSENDSPAFAAFTNSFGVANLHGNLTCRPRYVVSGARSAGFVQVADALLAQRA